MDEIDEGDRNGVISESNKRIGKDMEPYDLWQPEITMPMRFKALRREQMRQEL